MATEEGKRNTRKVIELTPRLAGKGDHGCKCWGQFDKGYRREQDRAQGTRTAIPGAIPSEPEGAAGSPGLRLAQCQAPPGAAPAGGGARVSVDQDRRSWKDPAELPGPGGPRTQPSREAACPQDEQGVRVTSGVQSRPQRARERAESPRRLGAVETPSAPCTRPLLPQAQLPTQRLPPYRPRLHAKGT